MCLGDWLAWTGAVVNIGIAAWQIQHAYHCLRDEKSHQTSWLDEEMRQMSQWADRERQQRARWQLLFGEEDHDA